MNLRRNKRQLFRSLTICGFLLALALGIRVPPASGKVYLEINRPNIRKIPLAVAPWKSLAGPGEPDKFAADCRRVMVNDLDFSTFFAVLDDQNTYLEDPRKTGVALGTFNFNDWSLIGAELLIKSGYYLTGDQLVVELRLFNIFSQKMVLGKRYRGRKKDYRLIVHKFCNEVVQAITGLPGEFSSKIAFVGRRSNGRAKEIYIMDYDGANLRQVTYNRSINLSPAWSPDVRKLAYTSYRNHNPDLYVLDFYSGKKRLLANQKGLNAAAAWAKDGREIALMQTFKNNAEISIISAATGRLVRRLTRNWANEASPCWSPAGNELVFVSDRAGSPQLYIMDDHGGHLRRLTFDGNYNADPDWSAYSNKIVFASIIDGHFQVCTINPDGSGQRQLTYLNGDCETPCWSPNGRHIVFTSNVSGHKRLMVMDLEGHNIKPITANSLDEQSPDWSDNQ